MGEWTAAVIIERRRRGAFQYCRGQQWEELNPGECEEEEERLVRPSSWSKINKTTTARTTTTTISTLTSTTSRTASEQTKRKSKSTRSLHLWYKNGHPRAACTHT